MIALQEELDWRCYRLYGITDDELTLDPASVPEINLGERAFEILMARLMAAGELRTTWFERHRSKPVTELYRGHPDFDVHALVAELVEDDSVPFLPVLRYKPNGLRKRAAWERTWDLQRREDAIDAEVEAKILGCGEAGTTSNGGADGAVRELTAPCEGEPVEEAQKRRKREEIGDIPPPPKYKSADFLNTSFWRLRGALDVPKERFVSYPHCSKAADPALVVAWAGWDHLQQAQALAAYYVNMKEQEGWAPERLIPLLAGLLELVPWIKQWHNDPDPNFSGTRMGDYFESFVAEEARELRITPEQIRGWTPAENGRGKRARRRG